MLQSENSHVECLGPKGLLEELSLEMTLEQLQQCG